ncbi:penicillin acylase [Methylococcaceae bacterium CS1]|nr:penicillin acylase family protein [Methyloprofundus sp.]TXK94168.1 penicillin acylase [Methylococcaceae bacterium CS4]TXK98953.1 penicillin acylase [Methylococcaceae bacterium CS5]TXL03769.1 penicillin acylase [Methylococcaceae bacterium CS3]TXL07553.1 penicillin acylase [Methylococcaceae bacterium CS1]TXL11387.1 penicillin acylase [Methylococcaceae bacterium CS2]
MKRYYFSLFVLLLVASIAWVLTASVAQQQGETVLAGLQSQVTVEFDQYATPSISATSKTDAFYTQGYLTASERLFQMDLMRRKASGQLSEVFGNKALPLDIMHRHLGFQKTAENIVVALPKDQRQILHAYTAGINAYLHNATLLAPEFLTLGYQPEPWQETDSILVSLNMFKLLNHNAANERMLTIMKQVMPSDIMVFLTPKNDSYNAQVFLSGTEIFVADEKSIPVEALRKINQQNQHQAAINLLQDSSVSIGSNQWATNKTEDGRAIIANDMHLPLAVPNLWYQARLNYPGVSLSGISLPGLPMMIAGSNQHVAWGFTDAKADVLDLVSLTINPDNKNQYQTPSGWKNFKMHSEVIQVKGEPDTRIEVRQTQWGPVSPKLLLGKQFAIQWTLFHPEAVNLSLAQIDQVKNIDEAITLFNQAGLPPLNVTLADNKGHIAWTLTGKFPRRTNFDGAVSVTREQADISWHGMRPTSQYPHVIDPDSGILMTANNRVIAQQNDFLIGHNFANGFRAYRIAELLKSQQTMDKYFLHKIQLDTKTNFYTFYQQLALSALTDKVTATDPLFQELKSALQKWDGYANAESISFGLLVEYRVALANLILSSYLQQCKAVDKNFHYHWRKMDTPLRLLLTYKIPDTLPGSQKYSSWNDLIIQVLKKTAKE